MSESKNQAANDEADHLLALIKQLIKEKQYDGVYLLFNSSKESQRIEQHLPKMAMDIYHDICLKAIKNQGDEVDMALYNCVEQLLKVVATHAPVEEFLLELLELIEDTKDLEVFIMALKAMQILLLQQGDDRPRALEWGLNSVTTHLRYLSVPDLLTKGYDDEQRRILDESEEAQAILMFYMTVALFYDPIMVNVCKLTSADKEIFRPVGITRRNVLCCFLIEMLGRPLCLFDLNNDKRTKTNTYSLQCAISLTKATTECLRGDPLFLLPFVEYRTRSKKRLDVEENIHEMSSCNIFLIEDKLPLYSLAIYYYMIFVAKVDANRIPLVYEPLYIFETSLHLIHELLLQNEPPLHEKALQLMEKLLENLQHRLISESSLELNIYKSTCLAICNRTGYSDNVNVRQMGLKVLRQYIMSFEDEGKYLVIKNLLKHINHHGIAGYLATLYKDLVAKSLNKPTELPTPFCGADFRNLLLNYICYLPEGVEINIVQNSDKILSSLNLIRYLALRDGENRTGFWNFKSDIERVYLDCLRTALNFSIAHFKAELYNVEKGIERPELEKLKLLEIFVANDEDSKFDLQLNREQKINILEQNLCTFDLIRSLLARTFECLTNVPASIAKQPT